MGYTSREGMLFKIIEKRAEADYTITDFEDCVPRTLKLSRGSHMSRSIASKVKSFYYGSQDPNPDNKDIYYAV